jgi:hypothetical protein
MAGSWQTFIGFGRALSKDFDELELKLSNELEERPSGRWSPYHNVSLLCTYHTASLQYFVAGVLAQTISVDHRLMMTMREDTSFLKLDVRNEGSEIVFSSSCFLLHEVCRYLVHSENLCACPAWLCLHYSRCKPFQVAHSILLSSQ